MTHEESISLADLLKAVDDADSIGKFWIKANEYFCSLSLAKDITDADLKAGLSTIHTKSLKLLNEGEGALHLIKGDGSKSFLSGLTAAQQINLSKDVPAIGSFSKRISSILEGAAEMRSDHMIRVLSGFCLDNMMDRCR